MVEVVLIPGKSTSPPIKLFYEETQRIFQFIQAFSLQTVSQWCCHSVIILQLVCCVVIYLVLIIVMVKVVWFLGPPT